MIRADTRDNPVYRFRAYVEKIRCFAKQDLTNLISFFHRDSLLVWGGTGFPFGEKCSNSLHAYHIPTQQWHKVVCGGELPTARYGQSMTMKDGAIYIIGGTTGYNYNMKVIKCSNDLIQKKTGFTK